MTRPNLNEIAFETNRLFSEKTRKSDGSSTDGQNKSFLQLGRRAYWTPDALQQMKDLYEKTSCPSKSDMQALADKFNCDVNKVHTWFKNTRQQHRRKNEIPESKIQIDSAQSGGRIWFSKQVKDELLEYFNEQPYLARGDAEKFAEKMNIPEKKIENWFKNQRQKSRKEGSFMKILLKKKLDEAPQPVSESTKQASTKRAMQEASKLDSETTSCPAQTRGRVFLSKEVKDDMLEYLEKNPYIFDISEGETKEFAEKWNLPETAVKRLFKSQRYKLKTSQSTSKSAEETTTKQASTVSAESAAGPLSETCKSDDEQEESLEEEINVEDLENEDVPLDDLVIKHQQCSSLDVQNIRVSSLENSSPLQPHHPIKSQPLSEDVKIATYQTDKPRIAHHFQNEPNHLISPLNPQFQHYLNPNFLQFCSMYQKYCHFLALQGTPFHS